ncbi:MAG: hypothetical protein ACTSSH_12620 [Candidatus Heimdallarchaeota archaeon]
MIAMDACYLCSREGLTKCSECYKPICRAHVEEMKGKALKEHALCTSCYKKRKLKRMQKYVIIVFVVLILLVVLGLVFTSLKLWG